MNDQSLLGKVLTFLRSSRRIHLRQSEVSTLEEIVALIGRFLEDRLIYPMEWDDFVSWKNSNPDIEKWRQDISDLEPLFVSQDHDQRNEGESRLINIRDDIVRQTSSSRHS